jgi:hypothetical protein
MSTEREFVAAPLKGARSAAVDAYEIRQNLRRRFRLSLVIAALIVVAELGLMRSKVDAAKHDRATHDPLGPPAFVLPPSPPPSVLTGARIRVG